ncbi:hypothetical protein [Myroides fluvii]|uniref:hypothetical protein n=1 Tax=Myroides fluvii TaxID=2572594 RepID=UPI00131A84FD|nr:hypothetical protein [Myroides fluvii]
MDLLKEYKQNTTFKNEEDLLESIKDIFMFGSIKSEYKTNAIIDNKEEINQYFINFLELILSSNLVTKKTDRLTIINLIDEFNYRNEILDLIKQKNEPSLKEASKRLGKKFMSSEK